MQQALRFSTHLKKQAKKIKEIRSGKRTRLLLLASAAELLDKHNLKDLHVSSIRNPVKASQGTFYIYFKDKYDLATQLFEDYIEFEMRSMPSSDSFSDEYEMSIKINNWYADMFQANVGIMRSFIQLNESSPEVTALWQLRGNKIVSRILEFCDNHYQLDSKELDAIRKSCHIMGNSLDRILSSMYGTTAHPEFSHKDDRKQVVELFSTLIVRAIFGKSPKISAASPAKVLTDTKLKRKKVARK